MPHWILVVTGIIIACSNITWSKPNDDLMRNSTCYGRRCSLDSMCSASIIEPDVCVCQRGRIFADNSNETCVDLDECGQHFHDPCGHRGVCMNTVGSYRCACLQGWKSDEHCSTNVSTPALCMPGYRGEKCSVSDCGEYGYGKPIGDSEEYICVCKEGWTHVTEKGACNVDVNECNETPWICENGATCENLNGTYRCNCLIGWRGNNCTSYNCTDRGCANNGVSVAGVCNCVDGWIGRDCCQRPTTTYKPTKANDDNVTKETDTSELSRSRQLMYIAASVAGLLLLVLLVMIVCVIIKTKQSKQQTRTSPVTRRHIRVHPNKYKDSKTRIIQELSRQDPRASSSEHIDNTPQNRNNLYYF